MRLDLLCSECGEYLAVETVKQTNAMDGLLNGAELKVKPCYRCTEELKRPIEALRKALEPAKQKRK